MKYLTEDITGHASGIKYGKKGDAVKEVGVGGELSLVEGNGHRFYVRPEQLSEDAPVEIKTPLEPIKQPAPVPERKQYAKPPKGKTPGVSPKQTNLF